ncbi:MAG: GAF domain-containing SpoIIE family protein phosphatase [Nitrospirota bacterium]
MAKKPKVAVPEDYLKNLEKKVEDLKILTEISTVISSTLDLNELMTLVIEKAKNVMDAEACSILLYNKETDKLEFEVAICKDESTSDILKKKITLDMGQGIAGWVAANQKPLVIKDVKKDKRFFHEADKQTGFITKSLIAMPLVGRRGLIGVAEVLNPRKEDYDLEIFQLLNKQFAIAIENALFHKESIEREKLRQELEIASALQKSFLPESPVFKKGNVRVSAVNISAAKVGGDIYDFVEPINGKMGILIGDVSGKGVSAALYMAKIISDFRYISHQIDSPEIVMNRLNSFLSEAPRGMFLTAIYMIVNTMTGKLKVSVAGHPPFLWLSNKEVKVMSVPSDPPLGIIPVDYSFSTFSLRSGDRLILLTDGVFEAKNKEGQRIGFNNLVSFVKKNIDEDRLVEVIIDYVNDFSKGIEKADDLTIVELRFSG